MARDAPLAFDALDHRTFFTANVCASATAQFDKVHGQDASSHQLIKLDFQYPSHRRILVPQVNVTLFSINNLRSDKCPFQK